MGTVLVVEDDAIVRLGAVAIVEDAGLIALEAGDADEAIRILESRRDIRVSSPTLICRAAWTA
jgi:CheY-like chemotaxis protein